MRIDLATLKRIVREEVKRAADSKSPGIDAKAKERPWETGKRKRTRKRKHAVQSEPLKEVADNLLEVMWGSKPMTRPRVPEPSLDPPEGYYNEPPSIEGVVDYLELSDGTYFEDVVFDMDQGDVTIDILATNEKGAVKDVSTVGEPTRWETVSGEDIQAALDADPQKEKMLADVAERIIQHAYDMAEPDYPDRKDESIMREARSFTPGSDRDHYGPFTGDPRDPRHEGASLYDFEVEALECGARTFVNVVLDMEDDVPYVNVRATTRAGVLEMDENGNTFPVDAREVESCFEADPAAQADIKDAMMTRIRAQEEAAEEDRLGV